ncbi:hypothetical protein ASF34_14545 [Methylobacterium sp. Leaf106]|uniref:Uncharacterized protein n=1 Tax=Methylobacterium bullatum TaxID=570505 RepID=A0A679K498_9HYPH|nr:MULTISPECIES: hypothetical protein [Methylobacterium]KQO53264.1 hypothetical protein ASF08_18670 [Methylobacterium sp. Leaf85]KQP39539.1 hypothetical protein ASF34_14545 [Methylobacterium sp. Leaf106]TXN27776.1 hypothetical protein FV220_10190 [Methylobacterium sp. WL19]MBD8904364.1 hypothetical protein [Methylobacterium bullatum]CAA2139007.1 hypothetical protein MBLL_01414 [Methylobacterium bullatum]
MYASVIERDESLDSLAGHCIAARTIIEASGTSVMRQLIDLLLFEIGVAMAKATETEQQPARSN